MLRKGSGRGGGASWPPGSRVDKLPSRGTLPLSHPVLTERRGLPWGWNLPAELALGRAGRTVGRKGML